MNANLTGIDRKLTVAVIIMGIAIRSYLVFVLGWFQEDALVTARFGENLWHGIGFVYNEGSRILGFTSPLWTIILTPMVALFPFHVFTLAGGVLCILLYCACLYRMSLLMEDLQFTPLARLWTFCVISLHDLMYSYTVGGMETSLFLLLILLAIHDFHQRSYYRSFLFSGLTILTRPEGVLLFLCLAVIYMKKEPVFPFRYIMLSVMVILPWIIFATAYYGSPVPQSAIAKGVSSKESVLAMLDAKALWGWLVGSWRMWLNITGINFGSLPSGVQSIIFLVWTLPWFVGIRQLAKEKTGTMCLVGGFFVFYASFFIFGSRTFCGWYAVPGIAMYSLVSALGVESLMVFVTRSMSNRKPVILSLCKVMVVVVFVLFAMGKMRNYSIGQAYEDKVRKPLGEYLYNKGRDDVTLMLEPIGYVAYLSKMKIIDLGGIVDPEIARRIKDSSRPWAIQVMKERSPDYIVLRNYEVRENKFFAAGNQKLFQDDSDREWFKEHYALEKRFPYDRDRDYGMDLYKKIL